MFSPIDVQERHDATARAAGGEPGPSVAAEILHFFGEVEVIFGLWVVVLAAAIALFFGGSTATHYLNDTVDYTEALFVIVIMALAATRPVLAVAEAALGSWPAWAGARPRRGGWPSSPWVPSSARSSPSPRP